ncbi:hypothetical protein GYA49_02385 [Candidatus Beckwithbacteria bacterium]|nr:hypothetical protein [Candidatus Beckwithbacteria bacterium]
MKIKTLIISCIAAFFAFLFQSELVFAQVNTDIGSAVSQHGFFKDNIGTFITQIINTGLILGAILCLFYLIIGAIEWITSEGDQNKNESARKRITAAVVGLGVMACIYALWVLVLYFFGIDKISNFNIGSNLKHNFSNVSSLLNHDGISYPGSC